MAKFKKGDRVIRVRGEAGYADYANIGDVRIVDEDDEVCPFVTHLDKNGERDCIDESDYELYEEPKQTPCEKIGLKAGDRVEVVDNYGVSSGVSIGDILTLRDDDGTENPIFLVGGARIACVDLVSIRPLKTEADRRGAKFGTLGYFKTLNKRVSFIRQEGEIWVVSVDDAAYKLPQFVQPQQIRLDHEPEFVQFGEAPEDVRATSENVEYDGKPVSHVTILGSSGYVAFVDEFGEGRAVRIEDLLLTVRLP